MKSTYTVGASPSIASDVTLNGLANNGECTSTDKVGPKGSTYTACCSLDDCNSVLYCYVGSSSTTMVKSICMPTAGQFCKVIWKTINKIYINILF